MQIVFIHRSKAFLPELDAYTRFFNRHGIKTCIITSLKNDIKADVEWYFMGIYPKRSSAITIHEYASASVPPLASMKNLVKRKVNAKPDFRIFLNDYIRQRFGYRDDIPSGIRDMGIDLETTPVASTIKEYDFIYTGSIATHRKLDRLLHCFTTGALREHSLLILSNQYDQLAKKMSSFRNIQFAGPVPQPQVRNYLRKASFGINYIVDEVPFNQQTSSKLVEYAAAGLPVITNSYDWVNTFEQKSGASFFKINNEFSNLTWEQVTNFDYRAPDLSGWSWDEQIKKSGIIGFLQSAFPGIIQGDILM